MTTLHTGNVEKQCKKNALRRTDELSVDEHASHLHPFFLLVFRTQQYRTASLPSAISNPAFSNISTTSSFERNVASVPSPLANVDSSSRRLEAPPGADASRRPARKRSIGRSYRA